MWIVFVFFLNHCKKVILDGVALLLLWALNKGIFGAKRIPKTDTCSSFKILQTYEDISFSITDLMFAVVCFAGFPEELQKHFFLLHLYAWGLHRTEYHLCFCLFSILRLEACSSLLSFGAGQPYSVPGQSLPPTSYFRQRFVRNS